LGFKGRGEGLASFDAVGDVVELGGEVGIFLAFGEHFDGTEDGQAGADEGEKLLIEDEKWFELDLAAAHSKAGTGFDGEDVVAGMGEAGSQFVGSRGGLRLLLDAATLIGQLDNELCHGSGCRLRMPAFPRYICQFSGYQLTLPVLVTDRRGKWMGRSGGEMGSRALEVGIPLARCSAGEGKGGSASGSHSLYSDCVRHLYCRRRETDWRGPWLGLCRVRGLAWDSAIDS